MSAQGTDTTRRLLAALDQAVDRIEALERERHEPIAVIGLSCRFAGSADTPERYWQLLRDGVDAISEVPRDRWDIGTYFDANPDAPGKTYSRFGSFVGNVDRFDAAYFEIAPREATSLDPQQRLLLELTAEALERANLPRSRVAGSATGVFVGITNHDYERILSRAGESRIDMYFSSGNTLNAAAGRIAYVFGLRGPALAVDTACSSSAVAIHLACRALRGGDCRMALAGGVNLILSPEGHIALSRGHALAPDGRCKTFDAAADGYVRGEGGGIVLLKRLADAHADGDVPLAIIRGSAVNQDGASGGFTVPSGTAQQDLLRRALADAQLEPADVAYVEAHGTGTSLGDPIEVGALSAVLASGRSADNPLLIGSVKTNIGHTESAAGVAGFIKLVLALQHGEIPPHLHFRTPSRHIDWSVPIRVVDRAQAWPHERRIGGISSFGASGTNAHIIVEAVSADVAPASLPPPRTSQLLVLSARTADALQERAASIAAHLDRTEAPFADIAYTLSATRTHDAHRLATVADSGGEAAVSLRAFVQGDRQRVRYRHNNNGVAPKVAFLFTGHGAQHRGMARELLRDDALFRGVVERCDRVLAELGLPGASDTLTTDDEAWVDRMGVTQPAVFAVQAALAEVYRAWGVRPDAVAGHSVGEYAASYLAGVFSLEDALRMIATRATLMERVPTEGGMVAVLAEERDVLDTIVRWPHLVVAARNGPANTVVSGPIAEVRALVAHLESTEMPYSVIKVTQAAHSPLMASIVEPFRKVAESVRYAAPAIAVVSTLTGKRIGASIATPEYWCDHILQPVLFADAVDELLQSGHDTFLEIGPHPVLSGLASDAHPGAGAAWIGSLSRRETTWRALLDSVGALHLRGVEIDWPAIDRRAARRCVLLPTYPFQRRRYWIDDRSRRDTTRAAVAGSGELSWRRLSLAGSTEARFESVIYTDSPAYFEDHRVDGQVVVAAAAFVAMALDVAALLHGRGPVTLRDVTFEQPLAVPTDGAVPLQCVIDNEQWFHIYSRQEPDWRLHVKGRVASGVTGELAAVPAVAEDGQAIVPEEYYEDCARRGIEFGPRFRGLDALMRTDAFEARSRVRLPLGLEAHADGIHPVLLDGAFQTIGPAAAARAGDSAFLPFSIGQLRILRSPQSPIDVRARLADEPDPSGALSVSLTLSDHDGVFADVEEFSLRPAAARADTLEPIYEIAWTETAIPPPAPSLREMQRAVIVADGHGVGDALTTLLRANGMDVTVIGPPDVVPVFTRLSADGASVDHVVLLHALDAALQPADETAAVEQTLEQVCTTALEAIRAVTSSTAPPRLWVVTRGTQSYETTTTPSAWAQSALWGLTRTAAMEHHELRPVRIDLDGVSANDADADVQRAAAFIAREMMAGGRDDDIALRDSKRLVPVMRRVARIEHDQSVSARWRIRDDRSYLVSGGLSGLGLTTAQWLVEQGVQYLVLAARSAPSSDVARQLEEWQARGVVAETCRCDVTTSGDVARVLQRARALAPLAGIIHSAGALDDATLAQQDWTRFRRVFGAKVFGGWHLHQQTAHDALDFFVLYSSTAGVLGSPGQANHAAANSLLDALAWLRRSQGRPATAIDWGAWSEVGIAARQGVADKARGKGVGAIDPRTGMRVLERVLQEDITQPVVASVDWPTFAQHLPGGHVPGMLSALVAAAARRPVHIQSDASHRLAQQAIAARSIDRERALLPYVVDSLSQVLGIADDQLDVTVPINRLGLDSLMAIELRNRFRSDLHVDVPVSRLLVGPDASQVAALLALNMSAAAKPGPSAAAPGNTPASGPAMSDAALLAQLDELPDEQVALLLSTLGDEGQAS